MGTYRSKKSNAEYFCVRLAGAGSVSSILKCVFFIFLSLRKRDRELPPGLILRSNQDAKLHHRPHHPPPSYFTTAAPLARAVGKQSQALSRRTGGKGYC
jgi:hypothetical protein